MCVRPKPRRLLFIALVTVLLVVNGGLAGKAGASPTGDVPAGYYESPTFGYLIRLDDPSWQITDEQSTGNADELVLTGPAGLVAFDGYTGYGGSPDACLAGEESRVAGDPTVSDFAVATDDDGNAAEVHAPGWAYRIYTLVASDASGTQTPMALTIDCRTLIPGSAVLEVRHYVPLAAYDKALPSADTLMHAVVLARRSVDESTTPDPTFYPAENMTYSNDGADAGSIAVTALDEAPSADLPAPAPTGTHWVAATIEFRNTGRDSLEADAGGPYVVDEFGVVTSSAYYRWDSAPGDPDAQVQSLPGGSEAIAEGWFAVADGARVSAVECDCFASLGMGTRIITSYRPRLGRVGPLDHEYYDCLHYPRSPVLVFDRDGTERALITVIDLSGLDASSADQLTLAVENSGNSPWTFDPRNVVVWGAGDSWPSDAEWETGDPADGVARTLAPHERGIVRLSFAKDLQIGIPLVLDAHYWAEGDQEVYLASLVPCQGSAGRPIIREAGR
jgi:hypothetical protein